MKRVVLDTNVVASACFWRGVCGQCLEAWVRGIPVLSPARFLEVLNTGRS
ncbi:MAG: hypothetical protein IT580_25075 [Verrucomicrobiales bacterium]|nr:hypothetical protein [Verrucomicrobiales bacterium]